MHFGDLLDDFHAEALAREHARDTELMMAGAVITVLPVLALFLALQRYYLQGLLLGSVKR